MKKARFPILLKVILLGIGVSILTAGVAIVLSYVNQRARAEATFINNIDNTLDEIEYFFTDSKSSQDNLSDLDAVRNYIEPIYNSDTEHKKQSDFDTFDDFVDYYSEKYPWLYDGGTIGLSYEMAVLKSHFARVTNLLTSAQLSSGTRSAFFAFTDANNNIVMLSDSRFFKHETDDSFFHVPGSFYEVKKTDYYIDEKYDRHSSINLAGYRTRFTTIVDETKEDPNKRVLATLFIEYNFDTVEKESREVLITELWILGILSVTLVGLYALFSYLLFVKNINRLSRASKDITNKLIKKDMNEIAEIKVNSNDEMRDLADSFNQMEQEIINYVDIINKEAVERERTNAELSVASKIQLDSLPDSIFEDKNASVRAFIKTAKEVGGDFYDYFYLDDHRLVVLISDVSGKGVPASLFMMKGKELIKSVLQTYDSLKEAINNVNNMLVKNNKEFLFITSFIGIIDFSENEIRYINAGHEKPYIVSKGKVIKLDGESNIMLGVEENFNFTPETHEFNENDYLFMFTDGLNETINDDHEEFGYQRIEETLEETSDLSLDAIINKIQENLDEFSSCKEQFDDITLLLTKYRSNELKLNYENKDYEIIPDIVDKFNNTFSYLSKDTKSTAGIIIDEIVNNFISYEKKEDLVIKVDFNLMKAGLRIRMSCNGEDYDPFANHKEKYIEEFQPDMALGGFGLSIVKDFSKSHKYQYKDGFAIIEVILEV